MILVGGLLTGVTVLAFARGDVRAFASGCWTLLAVALPGYVVMRIGAEWIYARPWGELPEGVDEPAWIGIGYIIADVGALLTLIALILGGIGVRRLRDGKGTGLLKATMILALIVLAAAVVAVWACLRQTGLVVLHTSRIVNLVHAIRPSDENVALLLHVLGAMLLIGGLLTAASSLLLARESVNLLRLGYVALSLSRCRAGSRCLPERNGSTARKVCADEPIDSAWSSRASWPPSSAAFSCSLR